MFIDRHLLWLIVIGLLVTAVLVITIRAIWQDYRRRSRVTAALNQVLGGGRIGFPREGVRSGWNYRVVTTDRYRELEMVPPLRLRLFCTPPFFVFLRRKNEADRFFERFRFFHPIQTGDPEFDQPFSVISFEWNPGTVENWLNDPGQRVRLKALMDTGCKSIRFDPRGITVTLAWNDLERHGAEKALNMTLDNLVPIADFLKRRSSVSNQEKRRNLRCILLKVMPLALLVVGEVGGLVANAWCRPLNWGRLDTLAALSSLPLMAAYLLYLIPWLKARSSSAIVWISIIVMAYAGFWFTGRSLIAGFNALGDTRPGVWRDALILRKEIDFLNKDLNPRKSMLHVRFRSTRVEEVIPVSSDIFSSARPGRDYLQLLLRPGRLGYPWIGAMRLSRSHPVPDVSLPAPRY